MREKIIYTLSVLLGAITLLMMVGIATGISAVSETPPTDPTSYVQGFCFDGDVDQMDISDIVDKYTKKTNEYFNEQIAYIMTHPEEMVPSPSLNDYPSLGGALCKNAAGKEVNDMTCQAIAVCNQLNAAPGADPKRHPFCMAMTLMGVAPARATDYNWERLKTIEPLKYSYFCYKAALELKRDALFDSTPQSTLAKCGTEYEDAELCDLKKRVDAEQDPTRKASLQLQMENILSGKAAWWNQRGSSTLSSSTATLVDLAESASQRAKFVQEEVARAKAALDQTLDAYGQLKIAWQMHVQYMDIFSELVKYRDHLVDVRKQTDTFPFKFIDATSTKCL